MSSRRLGLNISFLPPLLLAVTANLTCTPLLTFRRRGWRENITLPTCLFIRVSGGFKSPLIAVTRHCLGIYGSQTS